jgi:membrane protein implicated in regulation of membrane protease activity
MTLLRIALACFVLAALGLLFVPFAAAKIVAGVFAALFVLFLVTGLATLENLVASTPPRDLRP